MPTKKIRTVGKINTEHSTSTEEPVVKQRSINKLVKPKSFTIKKIKKVSK